MSTPKNKDPQIIEDTISIVSGLLAQYGWYVLAVVVGSVWLWRTYLADRWYRLREGYEDRHTDPEVLASRAEQMERTRRRQQELYDRQREEYDEKEEEKQRQKREALRQLETSVDDNIENELRKRNSKSLRDNSYNPLMGSSSGATYRPRKPAKPCGPCGGGGCG